MENPLLLYLLLNIGLLLLVATCLTELRPLRSILKNPRRVLADQLVLGLIFGLLSITCTYTGLDFQGAVVNTRVISTLAAGLVGGPLPGLIAGTLSGIHRCLYNPGGFTSLACGIGTFLFGVIGALSCHWYARQHRRYLSLVGLVLLAETVQCVLILLLSRPLEAAIALERVILLPKMAVNSAGMVLFMGLLDRLNRSRTIELAEQQSLALLIAQKCLPYLRNGISSRSAMQKAVDTVRDTLPDFQVVITDTRQVLAASGIRLPESPLPAPAVQAMAEGKLVVASGPSARGDHATLASPLLHADHTAGSLILIAPLGPNQILEADMRVAESLAQTFSAMLELGELQHEVTLRQQAELRALQSQINPHFLFNGLNTISALCLTDPNRARETILALAGYLRQTLTINEPFVTLEQELSNVNNYLFLTEARFENALHVSWELPENREMLHLPPLILQPIVENAVRHGKVSVDDRRVHISIRQDQDRAYIRVSDQGHGFPPQVLEKLQDPDDPTYTGLFNVRKRLRSIYGSRCQFSIESTDHGSTVSFSIPLNPDAPPAPEGGKPSCA